MTRSHMVGGRPGAIQSASTTTGAHPRCFPDLAGTTCDFSLSWDRTDHSRVFDRDGYDRYDEFSDSEDGDRFMDWERDRDKYGFRLW
jgi:hypothetical protein